ncbi:hypothetical protein [Micromonospora sp. WMMD812]|uniref:hypothetical protein n=1 Tax=Micromonospora sp. WMMD812 TaxID=3015152 RepID=UPI00248D1874|nr:hypothetical protein [Micromonospora sp. WMMD812]WBB65308.1 hypothetical protein O7603_19045 [Micromonospora sp. WMMD812]
MPSDSSTPADSASVGVGGGVTSVEGVSVGVGARAAVDRVVAGMTAWWLAFPVALMVGLGIVSRPSSQAIWFEVGRASLWVGLGGAAVAPAAGIVVALIGRRRRACLRFVLMGALSITGFVCLLILRALAE